MPYEKELDKQIFAKSWEDDDTRITVSIFSYNNGPKKLQISRENKTAEGELRFAKLGRLTKDEALAILPHLNEAMEHF